MSQAPPVVSERQATVSIARAVWRGFVRDRSALFFTMLFPLMFLVLFGGIFDTEAPRTTLIQVGDVPLIEDLRGDQKATFDQAFELRHDDNLEHALQKVRDGDADGAVEQQGNRVVVHFSQADRVRSSTMLGVLGSVIDGANVAATGEPPTYVFAPQQVEDESLKPIQYFTPGLLGWALASSATFGAGSTLVQWRTRKVLRRLRLAPIHSRAVISARVLVSLGVALLQGAIFLAVARFGFDLQLRGAWWMVVPLLVAGTLAFLSLGLLIGSLARTVDSAQAASQLVVMPMAFLSGSFFPLDAAPVPIRAIARALPLRYLNEGMLDVMVRGKGPSAALVPIVVLLGLAAVLTTIATRVFRWDTD